MTYQPLQSEDPTLKPVAILDEDIVTDVWPMPEPVSFAVLNEPPKKVDRFRRIREWIFGRDDDESVATK